jgi:hypothetical protein
VGAEQLATRLSEEARRFWQLVPRRDKTVLIASATGLSLFSVLAIVNAAIVQPYRMASRAAECKQNLHAIQLAVERFAVDSEDGAYPLTVSSLKGTDYLPNFPSNPFTGQPMQEYSIDAAEIPPGDFVYYPRWAMPEGSSPNMVMGYTLALGNGVESLRESIAKRGAQGYQ